MPAHTYVNILNFSFLLFIKKWGTQGNLDIPKRSKLAFQKRSARQACWSDSLSAACGRHQRPLLVMM